MKKENALSLQALVLCILVIGALVAAYYYMALDALQRIGQYAAPLSAGAQGSKEVADYVSGLNAFIDQIRVQLIPFLFGPGALAALILWLWIQSLARRAVKKAGPEAAPMKKGEGKRKEERQEIVVAPSPSPAVQVLSILQRQGRFIDFIQEDLTVYSDEQVGAAVRDIHRGCKEALFEHMEFKPIMEEEEGAEVSIQPGFDMDSIRLTGNVTGAPPFKGVLRHHGWRVVRVDLPRQIREKEKDWILDPAEVEVNG